MKSRPVFAYSRTAGVVQALGGPASRWRRPLGAAAQHALPRQWSCRHLASGGRFSSALCPRDRLHRHNRPRSSALIDVDVVVDKLCGNQVEHLRLGFVAHDDPCDHEARGFCGARRSSSGYVSELYLIPFRPTPAARASRCAPPTRRQELGARVQCQASASILHPPRARGKQTMVRESAARDLTATSTGLSVLGAHSFVAAAAPRVARPRSATGTGALRTIASSIGNPASARLDWRHRVRPGRRSRRDRITSD